MAALTGTNPVARWQKRTLDAALIGQVLTGCIWLLVHYTIGGGRAETGLPHWSEAWLMRVHGLAAFVVLVALGSFLAVHVPRGWRMRPVRRLDITMLACFLLAAVTAYCLYYFAPDWIHSPLGWLHAGLGGAAGVTIVVHRTRREGTQRS
jgi:hypothetical protein